MNFRFVRVNTFAYHVRYIVYYILLAGCAWSPKGIWYLASWIGTGFEPATEVARIRHCIYYVLCIIRTHKKKLTFVGGVGFEPTTARTLRTNHWPGGWI